MPLRELANKSRLADSGLTVDQRNATASLGGEDPLVEVSQTLLSIEQRRNAFHRLSLPWHHAPLP